MKKLALTPFALVVLIAMPALAAHAKPGLWKMTTHSQVNGSDMSPSGGSFCITPAQADAAPVVGRDCTQKNVKWSGAAVSGDAVCSAPVSGTGHFMFTYKSDTHYQGTYAFNGKGPDGSALQMKTQYSADYSGANCGSMKPLK